MPLSKERMAEYQRKRREALAAEAKLAKTVDPAPTTKAGPRQTNTNSEGRFRPYRDVHGDLVIAPATGEDRGGEHYWLRHINDDFATCTEFEFGLGNWIGGCGMKKQWEGKYFDGWTLGQAIVNSDHFKEIQGKMPVTKDRFGR